MKNLKQQQKQFKMVALVCATVVMSIRVCWCQKFCFNHLKPLLETVSKGVFCYHFKKLIIYTYLLWKEQLPLLLVADSEDGFERNQQGAIWLLTN